MRFHGLIKSPMPAQRRVRSAGTAEFEDDPSLLPARMRRYDARGLLIASVLAEGIACGNVDLPQFLTGVSDGDL